MKAFSFRAAAAALLALTATLPVGAVAQDAGPVTVGPDPRVWASVSSGWVTFPQLNYLNDASREDVGRAQVIQGSLEMDAGKVGGLGLAVATAELPVTYTGGGINTPCYRGCAASLRMTSMLVTLHVGGGTGFDMVYQASAGITKFSELMAPAPAAGIRGAATDFTGLIGYGFAYGFTPQLSVTAVGDIGLVFHKDPRNSHIEAGYLSHFIGFRAGLRYGMWNR